MVARGDLGIETDLSNLPNIQRKIMSNCAKFGVRSIVATITFMIVGIITVYLKNNL